MTFRLIKLACLSVIAILGTAPASAQTDPSFLLTATAKNFDSYFPSYLANGYFSTMTSPRGTEPNRGYMVAFMDTVATIPTGAMAERWKWKAFVGWGLFCGAIYYPIFGAWTWGGGWLAKLGNTLGEGLGYVDFAGSGVVHTVGGVIGPGESIMSNVPTHDTLSVDVRIGTADIDQVAVGQQAVLRFPALNQRTTPEIRGTVMRVGADLTKDPQGNAVYFTVRISVSESDREAFKIVPGMPVEAFITTHERTALSYLMKPVTDQVTRAFRER